VTDAAAGVLGPHPLGGSQAAAVAIMKSDMGKMGKVIRESGIRAD
jgi:hypothetical protein